MTYKMKNMCCSDVPIPRSALSVRRASAQAPLPTILLGVGGAIYTPHALERLKEPNGLDTHKATKLALKLLVHSFVL
eukprot:1159621-Pelagomonas_calceolata.AAC.22